MDNVTYALCKKLIASSATGITKIEVDPQDQKTLIFTLTDGKTIRVTLPIKDGCLDMEFVTSLPQTDIQKDRIYVEETQFDDNEGNKIFRQWVYVNNSWKFIGISGEPIATSTTLGLVKPDGITIQVDANGTISVIAKGVEESIARPDEEDIDDLFPELI